ncbi:Neprilysin-2 [Nymphon striatum]|nr:Neprilysin-2 [Nymphon striatum]
MSKDAHFRIQVPIISRRAETEKLADQSDKFYPTTYCYYMTEVKGVKNKSNFFHILVIRKISINAEMIVGRVLIITEIRFLDVIDIGTRKTTLCVLRPSINISAKVFTRKYTSYIFRWLARADAKQVNGYYNPTENIFGCAMNLGAVGLVIGHEISHGFDDQGSKYAANGTFTNWWSNSTRLEYNNKIQCFKTEYAKYDYPHVENEKLNTDLTIGEIIGDFTGIESSYHFLEEYLKANGGNKKHDSFGYTDRQLFWIAYGQVWCNKITVEQAKKSWQSNSHPPGEIRINGPLKHSQQFSKDFNCKTDDEMNPKLKCSLWE